jgi:hypothetical protein
MVGCTEMVRFKELHSLLILYLVKNHMFSISKARKRKPSKRKEESTR